GNDAQQTRDHRENRKGNRCQASGLLQNPCHVGQQVYGRSQTRSRGQACSRQGRAQQYGPRGPAFASVVSLQPPASYQSTTAVAHDIYVRLAVGENARQVHSIENGAEGQSSVIESQHLVVVFLALDLL